MNQQAYDALLMAARKFVAKVEAGEARSTETYRELKAAIKLSKQKGADANKALDVAREYGGIDGDHHKAWVIDQMVRALTGDKYDDWVRAVKVGGDGPETYSWDEGVAP